MAKRMPSIQTEPVTKMAAHYILKVPAGASNAVRLRFNAQNLANPFDKFD